jgi:alkylhydroperoxidase family enzyme
VFTVTEYSMLATIANTLRTPVDAGVPDVPLPAGSRPLASAARRHVALAHPRVTPIEPADMTPAIRTMLDPSGNGRPVAAVYRTFAQHPALYVPRQILSEYIRLKSTLSPRVREMLILRIGYLCQSAYEWAAHARAGRAAGLSAEEIKRIAAGPGAGWSAADAAILRAVDEIYADDVVSAPTWTALGAQFDQKQLLDVLITAGGYRMVSMALNTFGVPLEPDSEPLPPLQ